MKTPREIIEHLGEDAVAAHIGVAPTRVNRAKREAALPALWFDPLEELAGGELPRDAFHWKRAK